MTLTQARLRDLLDYDAAAGIFRWRKKATPAHRIEVGSIAGKEDERGETTIGASRRPLRF